MVRLLCLIVWLMEAEQKAKIWHQSMALKLKIKPKSINVIALSGDSVLINCGTKAIKKRATLGLNKLVIKPW